jgi:hypothetical protein
MEPRDLVSPAERAAVLRVPWPHRALPILTRSAVSLLRSVLATGAMLLAACSSNHASPADGGANAADARASTDATTSADSGAGGSPDSGGSSSGGDGASSSGGDSGGAFDAADGSCSTTEGGPYLALTWNEGCSSTVTGYIIEWGDMEGGPYPYSADAGDSCDASACEDGAADAQAFCQYDLRGLEAGTWCIAAEACDNGVCSAPSSPSCVAVPPACP